MSKEYRPTLAQLRTFATVAECKHFGTAAKRLEISQPSLSQALAALEHGLGMQLIERSTRRVIVTRAGEQLLPYAEATLEAADAFTARAQGASGMLDNKLVLGVIPTIAPYILPELLEEVRIRFPRLELQIVEDQTQHLYSKLRDGHIDCALVALPIESVGFTSTPVFTESLHLALPADSRFAGRTDLTPRDLRDLDLYLLDDGHCLRDQFLDLCRKADIDPELSPRTSGTRAASLTTVMQLVAHGAGATLVPESALLVEGNRPGIGIASFAPDVTASRKIALAYRSSTVRTEEFDAFGIMVNEAYFKTIQKVREANLIGLSADDAQTATDN
ncbi:MAG: LysR substrate-binding domain-containing protein [Corynebacterium sp.]|nr:LysR substrate-binding domain-containing protein [Corynebacterium sp.]